VLKKNSTIFLAGSSGLIGRAFEKVLANKGYKNILTPSSKDLDLTDGVQVKRYFSTNKIDFVILTAGKVGGIIENKNNPVDFLTTNLPIQLNVFSSAIDSDCEKVVFLGSSCMYPKECNQPMNENDLFTGKMEPTSLAYAVSKIAGLQLGFSYNQQFLSDKFLCVIPNSAYGPGDNFNPKSGHVLSALINRFHQAKTENLDAVELWGSGTPKREFIYSEDIADAIIFLLENEINTRDKPINIGSGLDYSILELAQMIRSVTNFKGQINWDKNMPDGSPRKLLDSSIIKSYGWRSKTTLTSGLENTYQWFLENIAAYE
jgi:GDP-L-fucose synthase